MEGATRRRTGDGGFFRVSFPRFAKKRRIAKRVTTRSEARIRAARAPPRAESGAVWRGSLRARRALGGAASSRERSHLAWRRRARAGANPGDGRRQRRRGQPPERRTRRASRRSYEGRVRLRFRDGGRSDDDPFRVSEVRASDEKRSAVPFEVPAGGEARAPPRRFRRTDKKRPGEGRREKRRVADQESVNTIVVWRAPLIRLRRNRRFADVRLRVSSTRLFLGAGSWCAALRATPPGCLPR